MYRNLYNIMNYCRENLIHNNNQGQSALIGHLNTERIFEGVILINHYNSLFIYFDRWYNPKGRKKIRSIIVIAALICIIGIFVYCTGGVKLWALKPLSGNNIIKV